MSNKLREETKYIIGYMPVKPILHNTRRNVLPVGPGPAPHSITDTNFHLPAERLSPTDSPDTHPLCQLCLQI